MRLIHGKTRAEARRYLMARVVKTGGHWMWVGPTRQGRYTETPVLRWCKDYDTRPPMVHSAIVSYVLAHGALPPRMYVVPTCGEMMCINPDHLKPATRGERLAAMLEFGMRSRAPSPSSALGVWGCSIFHPVKP